MDSNDIGSFCQSQDNDLGIGRLVGLEGEDAVVEYTDLPIRGFQHRSVWPVDSIRIGTLPVETRAYAPFDGYWVAGRVQGLGHGNYRIVFPGSIVADLDESQIEVRWNRPLSDPASALAQSITGSRVFHEVRLPFKKALTRQRSLVHGYSAFSSSVIGLYPHQIAVAARVLEDPILRYVLADEVGLGKTIEAGLIIRQILLDDLAAKVVVAVPATLADQWRRELESKFLVNQKSTGESGERVVVCSHEDLASVVEQTEPFLLVVDEAHQIADPGFDDYLSYQSACENIPGVLLLTATPLRGNAELFLRLLHLIDPYAYPLDDLRQFERRLDERQQDAYSVASLSSNLPAGLLGSILDDLQTRHGADLDMSRRLTDVRRALDEGLDLEDSISYIQTRLRETYRISRRVIRTRRESRDGNLFPVRGRVGEIRLVERTLTETVQDYLERLRLVLESGGESAERLYADLVERSFGGILPLITRVRELIVSVDPEQVGNGIHPILTDLEAELDLEEPDEIDQILGYVQDALSSTGGKGIVATAFPETAVVLAAALKKRYGTEAVAEHHSSVSVGERDHSIEVFGQSAQCRLLVVDWTGEEGRNLQVANFIVHTDIPLSVNRLEQRIGRVDRYGMGQPVHNIVLVDARSPYEVGWATMLRDGVGVLDASVAGLQRPLADLEVSVRGGLLRSASSSMVVDVVALRRSLDEEGERIDELEEIESWEGVTEFSADAFEELLAYEEEWSEIANVFDGFTASGSGGVRLFRQPTIDHPNVFEYTIDPRLKVVPMMRMDRVTAVARIMPGRRSFSRIVALRQKGVSLVRVGDPLVDWLDRYLDLDDRGRAWATWREVPGLGEQAMPFFRFDFTVNFDAEPIREAVATLGEESLVRRLRRRGDAFLRPFMESLWVHDGTVVPQQFVDVYLESVPPGSVDKTIAWKNWDLVLDHLAPWERRVHDAHAAAVEILKNSDVYQKSVEASRIRAVSETTRRIDILATSVSRLPDGPRRDREQRETEREEHLRDAILEGVSTPFIELFSCGVLVLASLSLDDDA